jgi:hypothetical protein
MNMNNQLNQLMEKNLLEVFGERDSARREIAINAIYTEDCTFFETNVEIAGRNSLNAKVESLLKGVPGFVFRAAGRAEVNHDVGRLQWHLGPPGAPPVVTGMDIALFQKGRIRSLYTFVEQAPGTGL